MLVQPGFGKQGARQGYRGKAAAASGAPGMIKIYGPAGDPTEGDLQVLLVEECLKAKWEMQQEKGLTKSLTQQSRKEIMLLIKL